MWHHSAKIYKFQEAAPVSVSTMRARGLSLRVVGRFAP